MFTAKYWPAELDEVRAKEGAIKAEFSDRQKKIKELQKSGGEWKPAQAELNTEISAKVQSTMTEDELFLLDKGISNQGFHYWGSAKFFGQVGKAFAETLAEMK